MGTSYRRIWPVLLAAAAINCGGTGGTGPGGGGTGFTATINGQVWQAASNTLVAQAVGGVPGGVLLTGGETSGGTFRSLTISLANITGPGTYALGVGPSIYGGVALVGESAGGGNANVWSTPFTGIAGTITITTLSGGRIAGSFQFDADPDQNNTAGGTRSVTNGRFDLPFSGTLSPVPANVGSRVSALFDGNPYNAWTAFGSLQVFTGGAGVNISTTSSINGLSIILEGVTAPGTFNFSNMTPVYAMTAGLNGGNAGNCCWGLNAGGDVITVTVTSLTPDRVQGTFSGTLQPQPGKPAAAPLVITNGTFDVGIN